jgi:hypothetical protein
MKKDPNEYKLGDVIGSFIFKKTEWVGKNKTWIVVCTCGEDKRFWKYSSIFHQKTCGCGTDSVGYTKEQRRMLNSRVHSYKSGANKRGLDWSLSYEEFYELSIGNCAYCDLPPRELNYFENAPSLQKESPNRDWSKYTIKFNGVDRVDSNLGYFSDNCVTCCTYCNRAKSDMSFEEFKSHIERLYTCLFPTK